MPRTDSRLPAIGCALPLHVGAARFGVLSLYSARPGMLSDDDVACSLLLAELATEMIFDDRPDQTSASDAVGPDPPALLAALAFRDEVYQAQGMVTATIGISLSEASARMRARLRNRAGPERSCYRHHRGQARLPGSRDEP